MTVSDAEQSFRRPDPSLSAARPAIGSAVNPFAVSRVGLAQLDFVEASPGSLASLVAGMRKANWRGQIIGPHGSGKTTLTIALARSLAGEFQRFTWLVLQRGPWWLARPRCRVQLAARLAPSGGSLEFLEFHSAESPEPVVQRLQRVGPRELCFVDGVDQLTPAWQRRLIQIAGQRAVVWTSHQRLPGDLAVLTELRPDLQVFRQLVARLLEAAGETLDEQSVDRAFESAAGDFRLAFGRLYDAWEQARRGGPVT